MAAAQWAGLFGSSCLLELLAKMTTHLTDLLHSPDQVLLHRHNLLPPKVSIGKKSITDMVQQLAVLFHGLSHVLHQNIFHGCLPPVCKTFFIS